jgi:hypothetical protein
VRRKAAATAAHQAATATISTRSKWKKLPSTELGNGNRARMAPAAVPRA